MTKQPTQNQSPERQRRVSRLRIADCGLRRAQSSRLRTFAVLSCATIALCGCQHPRGELFPAINPPMVWPGEPETPRMRLVGAISDSTDLKSARSVSEAWGAAFRGPRPPIRFSGPHAVAYHPADLLAVADSSGGAVHIVDLQERTHVVSYGTEQQRFAAPVGVVWADDQLFVSDAQLHQIIQLDRTGRVVRRFGESELLRPVGITYVPQRQEFYVVDGGAHTIVVSIAPADPSAPSAGAARSPASSITRPTSHSMGPRDLRSRTRATSACRYSTWMGSASVFSAKRETPPAILHYPKASLSTARDICTWSMPSLRTSKSSTTRADSYWPSGARATPQANSPCQQD